MKMSMTGQMQLSQQMKLAPRMIQSMEILQLNTLALLEKIDAELDSNPVLEVVEPETESQPGPEELPTEDIRQKELDVVDDSNNAEDFQRLDSFENDFGDYMNRGDYVSRSRYDDERDPKLAALNNTPATVCSLHEHLTHQWGVIDAEPSVKKDLAKTTGPI